MYMRLLINENYFNALEHDNFYIFVCISISYTYTR
jgi:hypothetical protein